LSAIWTSRGEFTWLFTFTELRGPEAQARIAEPHAVEHVEELVPEQQVQAGVAAEVVVLQDSQIQVIGPVVADVRQGTTRVAEGEGRRLAHDAGVEPAVRTADRRATLPRKPGGPCP
jgi:hypothetical protein